MGWLRVPFYGVPRFLDSCIAGHDNDGNGNDTGNWYNDGHGHGTHVAGIAAGSGRQSGACHGSYNYIGVAPEAQLIIVRRWGLTDGDEGTTSSPISAPSASLTIDAIRYLFNEARKINMPLVINGSYGAFTQFMGGDGSESLSIDSILTNNSQGRAISWLAATRSTIAYPSDSGRSLFLAFRGKGAQGTKRPGTKNHA